MSWSCLSLLHLSVILFPCLFPASAYDDQFVQFLLLHRPALIDGLSLNGTSLHQLRHGKQPEGSKHKVRVILNVENWSRFTLLDSSTDVHCGSIMQQFQAPNVYPGYREVMVGVDSQVFSGTCGTVSWQIVELSMRLIVMWSVPFNLNLYDTYMGIALIYNQGPFTTSTFWFSKMYYSEMGPHTRGMGGKILMYENSHIVVYGYIEAWTYHPMLNISVIPQRRYNLAPMVTRKLYNSQGGRVASVTAGAGGPTPVLLLLLLLLLLPQTQAPAPLPALIHNTSPAPAPAPLFAPLAPWTKLQQ